MTDLTALLERITEARGADRELDADIYEALGYEVKRAPEQRSDWTVSRAWAYRHGTRWYSMERLTSSIDAALGLVEKALPTNYPRISKVAPDKWECHLGFANRQVGALACASTAPLAILAALLRAKISEAG